MSGEDPQYCAWIRQQPCQGCGHPPPSHCHHSTTARGLGQRAHDHQSMALCFRCHDNFHSGTGMFAHWDQERRRSWQASLVASNRAIFTDTEAF